MAQHSVTSHTPAHWSDQVGHLERDGLIAAGMIGEAVQWLADGDHSRVRTVVDVGAGPGFAACTLAMAFTEAHVIALDPTQELLDRAVERAGKNGVDDRFTAVLGDVASGLEHVPPADLIWCSHVLHHLDQPVAGLDSLVRHLQPGGRIAIREGGLPIRVLPGGHGVGTASFAPRLDAMLADHSHGTWGLTADAVGGAADWPQLMVRAGLVDISTKAFVIHHPAPLDRFTRSYVIDHFSQIRDAISDKLDEVDARALSILLDDGDPRSLAHRPDLFWLSASTVHVGAPPVAHSMEEA